MNGAKTLLLCRPPCVASTFSPLSLSPALWLKADGVLWQDDARTTLATADGDPVGAWDDASGNARHALQATSGKRLSYEIGNIGTGLASVKGDGVDDFLSVSVPLTRDMAIFVVQKRGAAGTTYFFIEHGPAAPTNPGFFLYGGPDGFMTYRTGQHYISPTPANTDGGTAAGVLCGTYDGTNFRLRRNGAAITASVVGTGQPTGTVTATLYISSRAGTSTFSSADLSEIIICNSALTTPQVEQVEAYLKAKWGTP